MLFITYKQSLSGRSGHALCDIFTAFVISKLLDINVKYHKTWNQQSILSEKSLKKYTSKFIGNFDQVFKINNIKKWECLSWKDFVKIKNKISKLDKTKNILIELSNVCKIHPHIVHDWYNKKYIDTDIYSNKILPTLQNIYFDDHKNSTLNCISIHIRCGDVYEPLLKAGFTFDYYKNIINILSSSFDVKINIYCENANCQDVLRLKELKNTCVNIGSGNPLIPDGYGKFPSGVNNLEEHFNCMVNSKVLILSPSSLCLFAGYLCKGLVLIDKKAVNWRNNIYHSSNNTFLWFDDISEKISDIKKHL